MIKASHFCPSSLMSFTAKVASPPLASYLETSAAQTSSWQQRLEGHKTIIVTDHALKKPASFCSKVHVNLNFQRKVNNLPAQK